MQSDDEDGEDGGTAVPKPLRLGQPFCKGTE